MLVFGSWPINSTSSPVRQCPKQKFRGLGCRRVGGYPRAQAQDPDSDRGRELQV